MQSVMIRLALAISGVSAGAALAPAQNEAADAAQDEARWLRNVRQVTRDDMGFTRAGEAYFSPDGKMICFQAYPKGAAAYQIYVMNVDGTGLKMISTGEGATTCAYFSPDGKKVIFASNHLDPRPVETPKEVKERAEKAGQRNYQWSFYPGMDVWEYTLATGALKRLTTADGYDAECSYSPDGKKIVFSSMRDGDQDIYVCDADGGNAKRVVQAKGYDGGPFFSPDGKRLVYRSDRKGDGNMQIFVSSADGTGEKAITGDDVLNWCPFWHPSGKWIIFTRADHRGRPNYDLYVMRDDGSDPTRITTDPTFDGLPVFSADGRYVMWTSKRGGLESPHVFIADFVGLTPAGERSKDAPAASAPADPPRTVR